MVKKNKRRRGRRRGRKKEYRSIKSMYDSPCG
jgi:hypothetical protein